MTEARDSSEFLPWDVSFKVVSQDVAGGFFTSIGLTHFGMDGWPALAGGFASALLLNAFFARREAKRLKLGLGN